MNTRQEIIDWLINNDELVRDIVKQTNKVIDGVDQEFKDEAKDQQVDEITRILALELSKNTGLTFEDFTSTVDKETLRKVLNNL